MDVTWYAWCVNLGLLLNIFVLSSCAGSARDFGKWKRGARCHHCVYHYATESYEECRHPTANGGTSGFNTCPGRCYVRMDPNGYVYRGCASHIIFPGINTHHQETCSHQGHPGALWWFCDGALCNDIDLMDKCKDPVYPPVKTFNICDGHCRDPTGSYPDPHNSTFHIQCGYGSLTERRCHCCEQFYLRCPSDTLWDDEIKQCISGKKLQIKGQGYTYGYD